MEAYPKIYLYRRIVQAKLFIDENYHRRLNLGESSDAAHFSKFHFIRLFRKIYGCTPHQYLLKVRLEKAREMLSNGKEIAQVCSDAGFESLGSFSGWFRRSTGFTPGQYQLHQRQRNKTIREKPLSFIPNCFAEAKGWTKKSNF